MPVLSLCLIVFGKISNLEIILQCDKLFDSRSGVLQEHIEEAIKLVLKGLSLEGKLPEVLTSRLKCGELGEITLPDNREWLFQVVKLGSKHRDKIKISLSYPYSSTVRQDWKQGDQP